MIQTSAIVSLTTREVVNVIVADPERDEVRGFRLVAVPDGLPVDTRWFLNDDGALEPNATLAVEMAARAAAEAVVLQPVRPMPETDFDVAEVLADPEAVLDLIEARHG